MTLCECGCGELAPIAKQTRSERGQRKGEPVRFISGHHARGTTWEQFDEDPITHCWVWRGSGLTSGYGTLMLDRRQHLAHRSYYEMLVGPIPEGLVIDHLCRNRGCVNPGHMEPVTSGENTLRGDTIPARRAAQTHCVHGHPFDEQNTYVWTDGTRRCKSCSTRRQQERKASR